MNEVQFSYTITKEDYAEANATLAGIFKYSWNHRWGTLLVGLLIIVLPFVMNEHDGSTDRMLYGLMPLGFILLYLGARFHFARFWGRQYYRNTGLEGHQFTAQVSPEGILVRGSKSEWKHSWDAIVWAEEYDGVFTIYTGLTMFIFPKRHISVEQLPVIRHLIAAHHFPDGTLPRF